MATADNRLW